jgi:hypothetical protein
VRAKRWGHVPRAMTFEKFLAALERGPEPFAAQQAGIDQGGVDSALIGARPH